MKKCILFLLVGVSLHLSAQEQNGSNIKGSGTMKTEERALNNFTRIQAEGDYNLVITQDALQKVTIKTDDNIMPYVQTEVSAGKLRIFFSNRYHKYDPTSVTVYISSALIEDINLMGSGVISSTNQLKSKRPRYEISGSGNINLSVVAEAIETSVSGSGNIDLKGSADAAKYSVLGTGNINALSLISHDVKVKIAGSGDCFVNAGTALDVDISGSGNVWYSGTPAIITNISGSGKVKRHK